MGEMDYHEKHAFNLEHMSGVTCLLHLRMPNYNLMIDMTKHIGAIPDSEQV